MYDELVKRLRDCTSDTVDDCAGCPYQGGYKGTYCMNGLITEAADAIEELSKAHWIPVTERLPDNIDEEVLVITEDYGESDLGFATVAIYDGSDWLECWERKTYLTAITHWMPLPQPPKEES